MTGPMVTRVPTSRLLVMVAAVTGRPVGDADVPTPANQLAPSMPYAVAYEIPGGSFDGPPFADPEADATVIYQFTCVGDTRSQAAEMRDQVRTAILGRTPAGGFTNEITGTPGVRIIGRRSEGGPGGVDRIEGLFQAAERYALMLTPT